MKDNMTRRPISEEGILLCGQCGQVLNGVTKHSCSQPAPPTGKNPTPLNDEELRARLDLIFSTELSTTIRYEKKGGAGVTIYGIDRAIDQILALLQAAVQAARIEELERAERQKVYQGIPANPKYAISADYIDERLQHLKKEASK